MIRYKQGLAARLPVRLFDSQANPAVGVSSGSITVTVMKSDGTFVDISPGTGLSTWNARTTGAYANLGMYDLVVASSVMNVAGPFGYGVIAPNTNGFSGEVEIRTKEEVDIPDGVWDVVIATHSTTGSTGAALAAAGKPYVSFTAGGTTVRPNIVGVTSPNRTTVHVTFSASMKMTTDANGALLPGNYVITTASSGVPLAVLGASSVDDRTVSLLTAAQTSGAVYNLAVFNVVDLNGNVVQ